MGVMTIEVPEAGNTLMGRHDGGSLWWMRQSFAWKLKLPSSLHR
jgi:hypothetical protein